MQPNFLKLAKKLVNGLGINISRVNSNAQFPADFNQEVIDTILKVKPFTQTSNERLYALCEATKYIAVNKILGDIVECGVWRGGSMMAIAYTLMQYDDNYRNLYLFDTFTGMPEPSDKDITISGETASKLLKNSNKADQKSIWCYAPLDGVKESMYGTGYDPERIHLIKGKVEDTIPIQAPNQISLLRLDTDWYESTRHELEYLFPRIVTGGVIIIDDYGHWQGVRKAVDEYIQENNLKILLNRVDYTGRIGVVNPK